MKKTIESLYITDRETKNLNYNTFEFETLRRLKRSKYKDLLEWEKFFIKENVKLHRKRKKERENEILFEPSNIEHINSKIQMKREIT